jgi:hypothetical protein
MEGLFSVPRVLVLEAMRVDWPPRGTVWFSVVEEAMLAEGIQYPQRLEELRSYLSSGFISEDAFHDAIEPLRRIVRETRERYNYLYRNRLLSLLGM